MEVRSSSSGSYGSTWARTHEHGEWKAIGGGKAKVLRLVGIRELII
jgi:hypothetical protein